MSGGDGDEDDDPMDGTGGGTSGGGSQGGGNDVTAIEEVVRIDFGGLDTAARSSEPSEYEPELKGKIDGVTASIEGMAPNMKALVQYEEVQQRLHIVETSYDDARTAAKTVAQQFAAIQAKRYGAFMGCFKKISECAPRHTSLGHLATHLRADAMWHALLTLHPLVTPRAMPSSPYIPW